jgi:hypothetical protein|uniref:Uncharacterized protein n=1 Tax=Siphoviridae sp. ctmYS12 TaxID=2825652 RepID=A0A8S5P6F0_9CAUD|nr:MAG TPA: hypothetical protein [Siphoviridae sp. ctmYS12]
MAGVFDIRRLLLVDLCRMLEDRGFEEVIKMEFDGDWKFLKTTASIKDYHPFERRAKSMDDNENDALQIEMNQRLSVLQNQLDYLVGNINQFPTTLQLEILGFLTSLMNTMVSTTDEVAALYTKAVIALGDFEK